MPDLGVPSRSTRGLRTASEARFLSGRVRLVALASWLRDIAVTASAMDRLNVRWTYTTPCPFMSSQFPALLASEPRQGFTVGCYHMTAGLRANDQVNDGSAGLPFILDLTVGTAGTRAALGFGTFLLN